jgi:hypothetical protein
VLGVGIGIGIGVVLGVGIGVGVVLGVSRVSARSQEGACAGGDGGIGY